MSGTDNTQFDPNETASRSTIIDILYNVAGSPSVDGLANPFTDVPDDEYYADAVKWASASSIIAGVGDGLYDPDAPITRQDLVVILSRFANLLGLNLPGSPGGHSFSDEADCAGYAKDAIDAFFQAGIIAGYPDGSFRPTGEATKAEVAAIIVRFIKLLGANN